MTPKIKKIGRAFQSGTDRYVPVDCIDEEGIERQFIISIDSDESEEGAGLVLESRASDEGKPTRIYLATSADPDNVLDYRAMLSNRPGEWMRPSPEDGR